MNICKEKLNQTQLRRLEVLRILEAARMNVARARVQQASATRAQMAWDLRTLEEKASRSNKAFAVTWNTLTPDQSSLVPQTKNLPSIACARIVSRALVSLSVGLHNRHLTSFLGKELDRQTEYLNRDVQVLEKATLRSEIAEARFKEICRVGSAKIELQVAADVDELAGVFSTIAWRSRILHQTPQAVRKVRHLSRP